MAVPALLKAVRLRSKLVGQGPGAKLRLAETLRQLGNGQLNAGQSAAAMAAYGESLATARGAGATDEASRMEALARSNLCTANTVAGNYKAAMPDCEAAVRILDGLPEKGDVARLRLLTRLRLGNALRRDGQAGASLEQYGAVVRELDPLDARVGPILVEVVEVLRPLGSEEVVQALRKMGVMASRSGRRDEALERFEEAMRVGGQAAPPMKEVVAYGEAASDDADAIAQFRNGQVRQAIESSRKAIGRLSQNASGATKLLRSEIEANLRSFEIALVPPSR